MAKRTENTGATSPPGKARQDAAQSGEKTDGGQTEPSALECLKQDHRRIEGLLAECKEAEPARKSVLVKQVCSEAIIHIALAEEILHPALLAAGVGQEAVDAAHASHDSIRHLVEELLTAPEDDRYRDAKLGQLGRILHSHVANQEESEDGLLAKAEAAGFDDDEIAARMTERRKALEADRDAGVLEPTPAVTFQTWTNQRKAGPRQGPKEDMMDNNRPDRDARGRFVSDDDDRYSGRRASASHSGGGGGRYADDDDRGRGRSGWHGDPQGHADASRRGWDGRRDDEDDRRGSRGYDARDARGRFIDDDRGRYDSARGDDRGRYGRDDDRGGSSRGHGGWFGDSGGHAEAARRGWDGRRDEDDGGRSYGGRSEAGRDERGRFTDDDRGRYGRGARDDDRGGSDRGHGGWFGDSEGHSEASRRGWEMRQGNGGSRYSRDRDDDRGGSGRGHGGWFGDPEGHSEASRRGWRDRS